MYGVWRVHWPSRWYFALLLCRRCINADHQILSHGHHLINSELEICRGKGQCTLLTGTSLVFLKTKVSVTRHILYYLPEYIDQTYEGVHFSLRTVFSMELFSEKTVYIVFSDFAFVLNDFCASKSSKCPQNDI